MPVIPADAGIHCGRSAWSVDLAEPAFLRLAPGAPGAQWAPASAGVTMVFDSRLDFFCTRRSSRLRCRRPGAHCSTASPPFSRFFPGQHGAFAGM